MSFFKANKAGERYISFWMFVVWIVIGLGMVYGMIVLYQTYIDTRSSEAEIFALRIFDCLNDNFNYNQVVSNNFDISRQCGIDKNIHNSSVFYFNVYLIDNAGNEKFIAEDGATSFKVDCEIQLANQGDNSLLQTKNQQKNLPACYLFNGQVFDEESQKLWRIKILGASNQA